MALRYFCAKFLLACAHTSRNLLCS